MKYILLALALLIPNTLLSFGFSFTADKWGYRTIAGVAALGALVTAYYSYVNSPEKQFEKVEKILKDFEEDFQIQKALQAQDICNLESWYQLKKVRDLLSHIQSREIIKKSAPFLNFAVIFDQSKWDEELERILVYYYLQGWLLNLQEASQLLNEISKSGRKADLTVYEFQSKVECNLQILTKQLGTLVAKNLYNN